MPLTLHKIVELYRASVPIAYATPQENLLDTVALPASNAWKRSGDDAGDAGIIDISLARFIAILAKYDAAAVGGYAEWIPLVSAKETKPAVDADEWHPLFMPTGGMTDKTLVGTLPTGTDFTAAPAFASLDGRLILGQTKAAVNATDKIRRAEVYQVAPWRWFQLLYHEGGSGSVGTLQADYVVGI